MRIVGGAWRGRSFDAPEGRGTRPTTDRMRESLASTILSEFDLDLSARTVLDAFAGSGGVGLELLSRGARHCTFCEKDRKACALIRKNCKSMDAPQSSWRVVGGDVYTLAARQADAGESFDIVFLDPPYAMPASDVSGLVEVLDKAGSLSADCLVVYERAKTGPKLNVKGFATIRVKKHGSTCVDILRREGAS